MLPESGKNRTKGDALALSGTLLSTFSGPAIDVAIKGQHTANHLQACLAWRGLGLDIITNFDDPVEPENN